MPTPLFKPGDRVTYWTRRPGEPSRKVVAEVLRVSPDGTVARVLRPDAPVPVRQVETRRLERLEPRETTVGPRRLESA